MNFTKQTLLLAILTHFSLNGSYHVSNTNLYIQHSTLNACKTLKDGIDSFNIQANDQLFSSIGLNKNDTYKAFVEEGLLAT